MTKKRNYSKEFREMRARRTPEQKAASAKKTSDSIRKWHAAMSAKKKKARGRKISKSLCERKSQIPPRMKKDMNKIKSDSFRKFNESPAGRENRKYIGYLSSLDMSLIHPEKRKEIIQRRQRAIQKKWDSLSPEERQQRIDNTLGKIINKNRQSPFYENDVPRIKDYCGVVTTEEMERMHG